MDYPLLEKVMLELSKLVIENLNRKEILISRSDIPLLPQIFASGQDWMSACGGKGRCVSCRMKVVDGMQHLSVETEREMKFRNDNRLQADERLACQVCLKGEVLVRIPKSCQLPHLQYS
jgi:2Fe-2S ferredoxin